MQIDPAGYGLGRIVGPVTFDVMNAGAKDLVDTGGHLQSLVRAIMVLFGRDSDFKDMLLPKILIYS